jgi:outer membrane biosynthesis protein TonB
VPVITNGNPLTDITVPVAALVPPAPAESGLGTIGWIVLLIGLIALVGAAILYMRSRQSPSPEPVAGVAATGAAATEAETQPTDGESATDEAEGASDEVDAAAEPTTPTEPDAPGGPEQSAEPESSPDPEVPPKPPEA